MKRLECRNCQRSFIGHPRCFYCGLCAAIRLKENTRRWREANPKKYKAINAARSLNWRLKNPEEAKLRSKNSKLKAAYGITLDDFNSIIARQKGKCKVCFIVLKSISNKKIHVDHDHKTNKMRGILCHRCNTAIGTFEDSPALLHMAARYLEAAQ